MATPKPKSTTARVTKLREDGPAANGLPPGQHVGDMLRQAREGRGMTIDMVADELMIRRFYLDALENGSFRDLPERVYATGFVRSYATYMAMDVNQVVDQFRRDAYGSRSATYQTELVMPEPVVHSVIPGRTVMAAAICALAVIIGGVFFATRAKMTTVTTIPSPPAEATTDITSPDTTTNAMVPPIAPPPGTPSNTTTAATSVASDATATGFDLPASPTATTPAAAATSTTTTAPVAAGLPAPTASAALPATATTTKAPAASTTARLAVEALQSTWTEVKDGKGNVLFASILKKGQLLPIPEQKGITLTTGNAGGLRVILDGQPMPPLGQTNEVKRGLALDADKLSKR